MTKGLIFLLKDKLWGFFFVFNYIKGGFFELQHAFMHEKSMNY